MTENRLGWMQHNLYLTEQRLRSIDQLIADGREMPQKKRALLSEAAVLVRVCMIEAGERLFLRADEIPWQTWARAHADLQLQRHAGQITEAEFHERCDAIRQEREAMLR